MRLHDMVIRHQNPDASKELEIRVNLVGEVTHDQAIENARINSLRNVPWIDIQPPHAGRAIVCGNGPSLKDTYHEALAEHERGARIFACNSAGAFLLSRGACAIEYQVILGAHPIYEKELCEAGLHLLASFCAPRLFDIAANPVLWQPLFDGVEKVIPESRVNFSYIGGGITVGNSALCLAHTMGFRDIHVHGFDSSFRDDCCHALPRDGDDDLNTITVDECGRTYRTAFDMKHQVIVFMELAKLLREQGTRLMVHGSGLLPDYFHHHSTT